MTKKTTTTFKNEYIIDMVKLKKLPIIWTPNGAELPMEKINGQAINGTPPIEFARLFSERPVKRMIAQYPVLFPILNKAARTITEYLSTNGKPLLTMYPNADIDIHDPDWQNNLSKDALIDLYETYKERKKEIDSMRGALHQFSEK